MALLGENVRRNGLSQVDVLRVAAAAAAGSTALVGFDARGGNWGVSRAARPNDAARFESPAAALDDVLDDTEEAARRLHTYRIPAPTALAIELSAVLLQQCREIEAAVPLLDGLSETERLRQHIVELHRLENHADDLMDRALEELYTEVADVRGLVRAVQWGDIYGVLERATDRAEDVAVALETILLKHG